MHVFSSSRAALAAASVAALSTVLASCGADDGGQYPEQDLDYIIPFAPGGSSDPVGREFSEMLAEELGNRAVVENQPGGDQAIGISQVLEAEPDGYTLGLAGTSGLIVQPMINDDVSYGGVEDADPLVKMMTGPYALLVADDSPYETLDDFIDAAADGPGELKVGTTARISDNSFALFTLEDQADISTTMVPYTDGAGEAVLGLLGGEIDAVMATASGQIGMVESGELRPLAHTGSPEYDEYLPGAVSFEEAGYDIPFSSQFMTLAPPGMEPEDREVLMDAVEAVASSEEWQEWCHSQAVLPDDMMGEDLDAFLEEMTEISEYALELSESREE